MTGHEEKHKTHTRLDLLYVHTDTNVHVHYTVIVVFSNPLNNAA